MLADAKPIAALIAAIFLQAGCAASPMSDKCAITGSKGAIPGMDHAQICDRFTSDLAGMLAPEGLPDSLRITLTLHQRGAIDAVITDMRDGAAVTYPRLSVDAIDRALRPSDVTRLAKAAADLLNKTPRGAAAAPTGKAERS